MRILLPSALTVILAFLGYGAASVDVVYEDPEYVMGKFYTYFNIYTDQYADGNHYFPSGWYNGERNMTLDEGWTDNPHSGSTCIKITWNGESGDDGYRWNGVAWQSQDGNWSGNSGFGYDLTGAERLSFWARTDSPESKFKFEIGYKDDSSGKVSMDDKWKAINTDWEKYEIDLSGRDLSDIVCGFSCTFDALYSHNPKPDGYTLYLDDIIYEAIDILPPDPPENLIATPGVDGRITLSWKGSNSPDVEAYRMYFNDSLLDEVPMSSTSWMGTLGDGLYKFGISAVDKAGNESDRSISFPVEVEVDGTPPRDVTELASVSLPQSRVNLSWTSSTSDDVVRYEVIYDNRQEFVTDMTWTSEQLVDGRLYKFTVRAVDEVGNRSSGQVIEEIAIDNELPSVTLELIKEAQHSDVIINYHLYDREKENLSIICEYSKTEDGEWYPASVTGKTEDIQEEYNGEIIWNSRKDIPSTRGMSVRFRITPKDTQQEGAPDDIDFELINILGDYNDDMLVDGLDLAVFRTVWEDQDVSREIGPAEGVPPNLSPRPDGVVNFEDLAVFSLMWLWSAENISPAPIGLIAKRDLIWAEPFVPVLTDIYDESSLGISLSTHGLMGWISIEYDPNIIGISSFKSSLDSNTVFMLNTTQAGSITLAFSDLELHKDEGSRDFIRMALHWKPGAKDVDMAWHYEIRDLNNRTIASAGRNKVISRFPETWALLQNYPNPLNPDTWIPYQLSEAADVSINIYTSSGQLVRILDLGCREAGFYFKKDSAAYWDGKNESGETVASGTYFYTISAGKFTDTRKMIVKR